MDATSTLLYALPCSLALYVGAKVLFPGPRRAALHRDSLPLLGETWAALKYADKYYDWEIEWTEHMEGKPWLFDVVGRPSEFVIGRPDIIEDVVRTHAESFGKGEYVHQVLSDFMGDGMIAVDGHKWLRQRKTASNLFSMRGLRDSMAAVVQENILTLHSTFQEAAKTGESLDLFAFFNRFTFEVIAEIAFGIKFGALGTEDEHPFEAAFNFATQRLFVRFLEPSWLWKTQRWLDVGTEKEFKKQVQIIDDTCYSIISRSLTKRQKTADAKESTATIADVQKSDLISLFLEGVSDDEAKPGEEFDPKFLRDIVVTFMTAGRDTTASALSWFFYVLSQHPEVEAKIRQEMAATLPDLASGAAPSPSMQQANDLVYLEAALKETLRLYPAVPSNIREALCDVVLCDGTVVKAGETVSWSSYSMGRMPHVWGPDAKEYKPERWLDPDTGKLIAVSPYKFTLFSAGPRVCLGAKLAMMEMKITAASVLSKYHLTVVPGQDVTYRLGLTLAMKNGLQVTVGKAAPCGLKMDAPATS
ncbi:hypothetical protein BBJ28_00012984 [Nothophytophthora sp. Chile5]|nr:hypothetical protein BBJ28_00012984 [Nothophytophthora sp. Chile5]